MSFEGHRQAGDGGGARGRGGGGGSSSSSQNPSSASTIFSPVNSSLLLGGQASMPTVGGRLPSLRPTRDLTLGGGGGGASRGRTAAFASPVPANLMSTSSAAPVSGPANPASTTKRTFVPNLNVAKNAQANKDNDKQSEKSQQKSRDELNGVDGKKFNRKSAGPGGKDDGGKSFGRYGHGNFVQTHSIFAEGLGGADRTGGAMSRGGRGGFGRGGGGGGGSRASAALDDDSVEVKLEPVVEIRQKSERNKGPGGGYFIADLRQGDSHPVRVPTSLTAASPAKLAIVKDEPMDVDVLDSAAATAAAADAAETPADLLASCSSTGEFFTIQLPSVLPRRCSTADPAAGAAGDHAGGPENIAQWPDGPIGTLQILDTGEVRLLLDSGASQPVAFNVSLGADVNHLQELLLLQRLSEDANFESDVADLHSLGRIDKRMICSPDIDALLTAAAASAASAASATTGNTSLTTDCIHDDAFGTTGSV